MPVQNKALPSLCLDGLFRFYSSYTYRADECWLWVGETDRHGYGVFWYKGRYKAHRLAYFLQYKEQPKQNLVCHTCDTPACVNPSHLFLGTDVDNQRDRIDKGHGAQGVLNGRAKLTTTEVKEIKQLYSAGGITYEALASRYGVTHALIGQIVRGLAWNHNQE